MPGLLISFEGIDFCGKSVQTDLLLQRIRDHWPPAARDRVLTFREPGGTRISEKIRAILLDASLVEMDPISETLLYSAARSQLIVEKIRPHLARGHVVILDRFFDSTTAFQGHGRGIDLEMIRTINRIATHDVVPDLTIILDLAVETADARRRKAGHSQDRIEVEASGFHERVRSGYLQLAAEQKDRAVLINGDDTIENIAENVWQVVVTRLPHQDPIRR